MQIKSILAAAVAVGCMAAAWTGNAAMSEEKINATLENDPEAKSAGEPMTTEPLAQSSKPETPLAVRNTRPKLDRHKDARACLEAGKNEAIIKCANKYR
jgi:hypothetical protein